MCLLTNVSKRAEDVKSVVEVDAKGDLEERKWEQGRGKFGPSQ